MRICLIGRAREIPHDSSVLFLLDDPYPPGWRNRWMERLDMGHRSGTVPARDVSRVDIHALCPPECTVYSLPGDRDQLLPQLVYALDQGGLGRYEDRDGRAIGYSYMPTANKP